MVTLSLIGHLGLGPRQGAWKAKKDGRRWIEVRVRRFLAGLPMTEREERVQEYLKLVEKLMTPRSGPGKRGRPVVRDVAELAQFLGVSIKEGATEMGVITEWVGRIAAEETEK